MLSQDASNSSTVGIPPRTNASVIEGAVRGGGAEKRFRGNVFYRAAKNVPAGTSFRSRALLVAGQQLPIHLRPTLPGEVPGAPHRLRRADGVLPFERPCRLQAHELVGFRRVA